MTRLILWGQLHRRTPGKQRVTSLRLFLQRLLENDSFGVCVESTNIDNPHIYFGEEALKKAMDGERLLLVYVTRKNIYQPFLWFLPYFKREYSTLSIVAIATEKDGFAKIEYFDESFSDTCRILWENLGRSFYLMAPYEMSDKIRFQRSYIWNEIKRSWEEKTTGS